MSATQKNVCKKYGAEYKECAIDSISGVAENVDGSTMPINGMRYEESGVNSGWYIWAGTDLSQADDFFKPQHTSHLIDAVPEVKKYLGLGPGWRFLINTQSGYEDVWYDQSLIAET